jgi:hypothetical protein
MKTIKYLLIILVFSSCSITTHYIQTGSKAYNATSPSNVVIYSETPEKGFTVIGSVAVYAPGDQTAALDVLKTKAASIGADAVIDVRFTKFASYAQAVGMSGTAIKFK